MCLFTSIGPTRTIKHATYTAQAYRNCCNSWHGNDDDVDDNDHDDDDNDDYARIKELRHKNWPYNIILRPITTQIYFYLKLTYNSTTGDSDNVNVTLILKHESELNLFYVSLQHTEPTLMTVVVLAFRLQVT